MRQEHELIPQDAAHPWLQMHDEPKEAYFHFVTHYLAGGPGRSLFRAYRASLEPGTFVRSIPQKWTRWFTLYKWLERAEAYDKAQIDETLGAVAQAHLKLQQATVQAVDTLIGSMTPGSKVGIMAAKEVLDRGGLPGRSITDVVRHEGFSADDYKAAQEKVRDFEEGIIDVTPSPDPNNDTE